MHLLSLLRRHVRLWGFGLRGRKKLARDAGIRSILDQIGPWRPWPNFNVLLVVAAAKWMMMEMRPLPVGTLHSALSCSPFLYEHLSSRLNASPCVHLRVSLSKVFQTEWLAGLMPMGVETPETTGKARTTNAIMTVVAQGRWNLFQT